MLQECFQINPEEAVNGQIAVDMFKEGLDKECMCPNRAYKLILMDINMPVKDGFVASEEILSLVAREQARLEGMQGVGVHRAASQNVVDIQSSFCNIVAVTSYTGQDVKDKASRIGIKKVTFKPLQSSLLQEIL